MDTFFTILKKAMVGVVFVMFAFAATYIPHQHNQIDEVEAAASGSVVFDPTNLAQNVITAVRTTASYVLDAWFYLKENVLDGLAWAIAKQILQSMQASLLDWINSGFEGSPAFVQDLNRFLLQAADEAVGEYIQGLGGIGSFICSPFRLDVQIAVAIQYDISRENEPPSCTLSGVIDNLEGFIEGDFAQGGWDDWFDIVAQPEIYTPYGAIISAQASARAVIRNTEGEELNLLNFGDGFLSGELCNTAVGANGEREECFITKPGRVLSEQLNKALGAGQDTLIAADEFDEIISALLGQLVNQAVSGAAGLLGLSGGTGYSYTGYNRGSFADEVRGGGTNVVGGVNVGGTNSGNGTLSDVPVTSNSAASYLSNGLTNQQAILNGTEQYIADLTAFVNNPLNDANARAIARAALQSATTIRANALSGVTIVTPIVTEYVALESEYTTADATRRAEIRSIQSTLLQQYNSVGLYTQTEFEVNTAYWDSILANGGTEIITDPIFDGAPIP